MTLAPSTLKRTHRASALLLALFVFAHLLNHLSLAAGSEVHLLVMSGLRSMYRWWPVELLLLLAVAAQIFTGLSMALPRLNGMLQRRDAQVLSGLYLSAFFVVHVGAILWGRLNQHLDTNLWFGAAGFHIWPWQLFFVPYYMLAIIAFATHFGFILQKLFRMQAAKPAFILGIVTALAVAALMLGWVQPLAIPETYLASYR